MSVRRPACSIALVGLLFALVALGWVATEARGGYAATRVRNALLADAGDRPAFDWAPSAAPTAFRRAHGPVPDVFRDAVASIVPSDDADTFATAQRLAAHLYSPQGYGAGIRSDSVSAYEAIRAGAGGYCSDFTQVMNGLGQAAGLTIREWGMSFDAYSGNGHAFSEVWVEHLASWAFIDSFYSFYVVDSITELPLSVLDFQQRLQRPRGQEGVNVVPITAGGHRFDDARAALDYYRRGAQQTFLYLGNDALAYDAQPLVRLLRPLPSSVEQLAAIFAGVHPRILLLRTTDNGEQISALLSLRSSLRRFMVLGIAGGALFLIGTARCLTHRRPDLDEGAIGR